MGIPTLKKAEDLEKYLTNDLLIVYFTAKWCGVCVQIAPALEQLYETHSNIEIIKVDGDEHQQLATKYAISAYPTFIFYHKKKQVKLFRGANAGELLKYFDTFGKLSPTAKRVSIGANSESKFKNYALFESIKQHMPLGNYTVLNDQINLNESEALNVLPLSDKTKEFRQLFSIENEKFTCFTDADSQGIFHIPFINVNKLYSILIKLPKLSEIKPVANTEISTEEDLEELQLPKLVKIWKNLPATISFEDASSLSTYDHSEEIDVEKVDENGFYEIKLKFVKFQNTKSIDIFIDGVEDEDFKTVFDKVVIIGISGESQKTETLPQEED